jgi:hypothetical protein
MSKRRSKAQEPDITTTSMTPVYALWAINRWHDKTLYTCLFCPFDTLNGEAAMLEHWREVHAPTPTNTDKEMTDGNSG